MDSKKIRTAIGRWFGWLGISVCSLIIKLIPGKYMYVLAKGIANLGFFFAKKQRNIALQSLAIAFGREKNSREIEKIAEDCFVSIAKGGVELVFLMDRPALLRQRVEFSGRENLDLALSKGRGVILVSAHFGNFPLMMAKISLEGYKIAGIMRPMRDSRVEKIFLEKRNRLGLKTIYSQPRKACVEQSLRSLRNNELLFIPVDQNFGTGGVFVDFFGKKAATATGPVVLALRTQAALLPCFIIRQADDTHKVIFEPALDLIQTPDYAENLKINVQRITSIIENYIRAYPHEWGWMHRRWKSKPN